MDTPLEKRIAYVTSLIGDPVRTSVLWSLLDGRAYTATELAIGAETSPQNMSMHLAKLVQAGLLAVEIQGRHRYYRFARPEVAYAIEAIGSLVPAGPAKKMPSRPEDAAVRFCRSCYDHLAGTAGVRLTDALLDRGVLVPAGAEYGVTEKGKTVLAAFQIDADALKRQRRLFAKPCLDWSERRSHLAGALGAALLDRFCALDYVRKSKNSRALVLTAKGRAGLRDTFQVSL